jgi:uncharacterized LabA/DUF88 family protein
VTTFVYVDAFNLYYGCLKGTPYRWLNLESLCQIMLPHDTILSIKYFTARITARPHNPGSAQRQENYLRALATLPKVQIFYGHYLSHEITMPLALPPSQPTQFARVIKTEEKGSDVNLATHLLLDACRNAFDVAVLITNDSDLLEPIRVVHQEFGKPVGILNPQPHPSVQLRAQAQFFKQIQPRALRRSQFSSMLTDSNGVFHKPARW